MGKLRYSILVILKAHFQIPNQFKNECVHKINIWIWNFSLVFFKALTFSLQVAVSVKVNFIFRKKRSSRATLLKKNLWHRYFPVNFAKFSRTLLQNTSGGLLLEEHFSFGIILFKFISEYTLVKPWLLIRSMEFSSTPWFKLFDYRLVWWARFLLKGFFSSITETVD